MCVRQTSAPRNCNRTNNAWEGVKWALVDDCVRKNAHSAQSSGTLEQQESQVLH